MPANPAVYSRRRGAQPAPPGSVNIARPSPWGNPYHMKTESDRPRVIEQFRAYAVERLQREPEWLEPLRGRSLVCWCSPKPCHGQVIMELLYDAPAAANG